MLRICVYNILLSVSEVVAVRIGYNITVFPPQEIIKNHTSLSLGVNLRDQKKEGRTTSFVKLTLFST